MERPTSLYDQLIGRPRSIRTKLMVSLLFLLLPFIAAYLDEYLAEFIRQSYWRAFLLAPCLILYIWLISPVMIRLGDEMVASLRNLVTMDNESFASLVFEAARADVRHEVIALGIGLMFGLFSAQASDFQENLFWLKVYWYLSQGFVYGFLFWTIYVSLVSTRLSKTLYQQDLNFDILDPSPFEAVGRQSLGLALVFVGGITLSLLLAFRPENLNSIAFWIVYLLLTLITLLIFFLSMQPTHQVLVAAKQRALKPTQAQIQRACQELIERLERDQDAGALANEINALVAYEARLKEARTWPYNTGMLRTLFFSVLIPLGSVLARLVVEVLFR